MHGNGASQPPRVNTSGEREMVNRAEKKKKKRRRFDVRDPDFVADFKSTERGREEGGSVGVLVWWRKQKTRSAQ